MPTSTTSIAAPRPPSETAPPAHSVRSDLSVYLDQVNRYALLTAEEERDLGWKIINDDCTISREKLIRANLRLVVFIAKKYLRRGLELTDLIEEGNVGLVQAAGRFDPAHGARFSTYASWWIKSAIKRALVKSTQHVHVPIYMVELTTKWKAARKTLETKLGTTPSSTDFAAAMNISSRMVGIVKEAAGVLQNSSSFVRHQSSQGGPHDMIADERTPQPHDRLSQSEQIASLAPLLATLDKRDAEMLRLRFGIGGRVPLRLKEIADRFEITGERVRQLIEHALVRLQSKLTDDAEVAPVRVGMGARPSAEQRTRTRPTKAPVLSRAGAGSLAIRSARRTNSDLQACSARSSI